MTSVVCSKDSKLYDLEGKIRAVHRGYYTHVLTIFNEFSILYKLKEDHKEIIAKSIIGSYDTCWFDTPTILWTYQRNNNLSKYLVKDNGFILVDKMDFTDGTLSGDFRYDRANWANIKIGAMTYQNIGHNENNLKLKNSRKKINCSSEHIYFSRKYFLKGIYHHYLLNWKNRCLDSIKEEDIPNDIPDHDNVSFLAYLHRTDDWNYDTNIAGIDCDTNTTNYIYNNLVLLEKDPLVGIKYSANKFLSDIDLIC